MVDLNKIFDELPGDDLPNIPDVEIFPREEVEEGTTFTTPTAANSPLRLGITPEQEQTVDPNPREPKASPLPLLGVGGGLGKLASTVRGSTAAKSGILAGLFASSGTDNDSSQMDSDPSENNSGPLSGVVDSIPGSDTAKAVGQLPGLIRIGLLIALLFALGSVFNVGLSAGGSNAGS